MIKYKGISTLEVLKEARNYNKWIADSLLAHIEPPVLEIGSGTGNLTSFFLQQTPLYITDNDSGLVTKLKSRFKNNKNVHISLYDVTKPPPLSFISKFPTVYSINVLEHIENDEKALKNIYNVLKPNGKLILLVPAKQRAYTRLDKKLGHFRRYEKDELINKLIRTGYKVEVIYFFNIVGLLSWYTRDKVTRKNIHLSPVHIKIFDSIVPLLRIIEFIIKIPVGISLIAVAKKVKL